MSKPKNYNEIHYWIRKTYGNPKVCENTGCDGSSNRFDWALIRGKRYCKKRENFMRLCRKCHIKYDWNTDRQKRWEKVMSLSRSKDIYRERSERMMGYKMSDEMKQLISTNTSLKKPVVVSRGKEEMVFRSISDASNYLGKSVSFIQNIAAGKRSSADGWEVNYG